MWLNSVIFNAKARWSRRTPQTELRFLILHPQHSSESWKKDIYRCGESVLADKESGVLFLQSLLHPDRIHLLDGHMRCWVRAQLATILQQLGRFDEASELGKLALSSPEGSVPRYSWADGLSNYASSAGQLNVALSYWESLLADTSLDKPKRTEILFRHAQMLPRVARIMNGRSFDVLSEKAVADYFEIINLASQETIDERVRACEQLASHFQYLGNRVQAWTLWHQVMLMRPSSSTLEIWSASLCEVFPDIENLRKWTAAAKGAVSSFDASKKTELKSYGLTNLALLCSLHFVQEGRLIPAALAATFDQRVCAIVDDECKVEFDSYLAIFSSCKERLGLGCVVASLRSDTITLELRRRGDNILRQAAIDSASIVTMYRDVFEMLAPTPSEFSRSKSWLVDHAAALGCGGVSQELEAVADRLTLTESVRNRLTHAVSARSLDNLVTAVNATQTQKSKEAVLKALDACSFEIADHADIEERIKYMCYLAEVGLLCKCGAFAESMIIGAKRSVEHYQDPMVKAKLLLYLCRQLDPGLRRHFSLLFENIAREGKVLCFSTHAHASGFTTHDRSWLQVWQSEFEHFLPSHSR